jgi:superfamily II DNA/RNA helicase
MGSLLHRCFRHGKSCALELHGAENLPKDIQGMDISNIKIVVQWKAPSDLSTLWQRFGRAARGVGEEGVAILIVQNTDIYENRMRKADKAAMRIEKAKDGVGTKRKATRTILTIHPAKRRVLADSTQNVPTHPGVLFDGDSDMDSEGEEIEQPRLVVVETNVDLQERRLHYAKSGQAVGQEKKKQTKRNEVEIGSPMDDFINAGPLGFKCRRVPPRLYFRNDKDRELYCLSATPSKHTDIILTHSL